VAEVEGNLPDASFIRQVHRALLYLYDPSVLGKSPLVELLGAGLRDNPAWALQRILIDAIAALKPAGDVPPQAGAWRIYRILFHRYTEQCTQREVATELGLSIRQLRRQEHLALQMLAGRLWTAHGLQFRASRLTPTLRSAMDDGAGPVDGEAPSREAELEWLRRSLPGEAARASEVLPAILKVVAPLAQALAVSIGNDIPGNLPRLAVPPATLRQALLNVLTPAIRSAPHGIVQITAAAHDREVQISIRPEAGPARCAQLSGDDVENLNIARELLASCGGLLDVMAGLPGAQPFTAVLTVPAATHCAVLVVDDNLDTLELFRRYLAGTGYPFVGTHDPEQALALAEELLPRAVILDLMLPGVDGWEILGRLREHPQTRSVPVIVCSILAQEQLALTLGASAFVRKPVRRSPLLATLERVIGQREPRLR